VPAATEIYDDKDPKARELTVGLTVFMSVPAETTYTSTEPRYGAPLTIRTFALPELGALLSSVVITDQTFEEKFSENTVESVPEVKLDV